MEKLESGEHKIPVRTQFETEWQCQSRDTQKEHSLSNPGTHSPDKEKMMR